MNEMRRKDWIDGLRGIAMLLVVSGHCLAGMTNYFAFTNPIKMPLFFAISGYLFKDAVVFSTLLQKLAQRIIIPWLCFGVIITIIIASVQKESIINGLFDMIAGESIWWFLPCFFWGEIIHYLIRKICPQTSLLVMCSFLSSSGFFCMSLIY